MDLNFSAYGPAALKGEKIETPADHKIQSSSGFQGVRTAAEKQIERAVAQGDQSADARLKKRGELVIDEATKRVYYRTKDPITGSVEKYPTEAQLRMAAALKEEIDRKTITPGEVEVKVPDPGVLLNTKA